MELRADRIVPVPGEGLVARWPAAVVVLGGPTDEVAEALRRLAPSDREPPEAADIVDRLADLELDHLAAVVAVAGDRRVFRRGAGMITPLDDDAATASTTAPDGAFWLGFGPPPFAVTALREGPWTLGDGIVAARGAVVEPAPVAPAPEPPRAAAFEVADLSAPLPPRAPLPRLDQPAAASASGPPSGSAPGAASAAAPGATAAPVHGDAPTDPDPADGPPAVTVKGIECSRGHFNNPLAAYCSSCGISLVHLTHRLVDGIRPALGFLVFDDGSTFTLDRSYLIGREPTPDPGSDRAPLAATDAELTVSRHHAELVLDGWDVILRDLGSTNGTFVWRDAERRWDQVPPERPLDVPPGARLAVGRRTFVYEPIGRST